MSPAKPFPALVFWALVVPTAMWVVGVAMASQRPVNPLAVIVLFLIPMAMELVAVPIAIVCLFLGYRTRNNVLLTLAGAIPAVTFLAMWFLESLSHIHF